MKISRYKVYQLTVRKLISDVRYRITRFFRMISFDIAYHDLQAETNRGMADVIGKLRRYGQEVKGLEGEALEEFICEARYGDPGPDYEIEQFYLWYSHEMRWPVKMAGWYKQLPVHVRELFAKDPDPF
jgi:hypothetical protein